MSYMSLLAFKGNSSGGVYLGLNREGADGDTIRSKLSDAAWLVPPHWHLPNDEACARGQWRGCPGVG